MRRNKNKKAFALIALALAFALVLSLAYFTDRAELNVKVTGGTVGISENASNNWVSQLQDGPQDLDNINPGDSRSLKFTVTNKGNKAIDVRHTIVLTVVDAAGNAKQLSEGLDVNNETFLQFDIFKASDVKIMSNASGNIGYVLDDGATPVFSSDTVDADTMMGSSRQYILDGTKVMGVKYYFADTILDGTGTAAETGYAKAEHVETDLQSNTTDINDIILSDDKTAATYDYILIFRDTTLNDFQGCVVHLQMVIEAKQHLNTKSSWENIETVTMTLNASEKAIQSQTVSVAPNQKTGVLEDVKDTTAATYNKAAANGTGS